MAHTYAFAIGGAILLGAHADAGARVAQAASRDATRRRDNCADARAQPRLRAALRLRAPQPRSGARRRARAGRRSCVGALRAASAREFMPKLEEGNFWIRATLPTSISLEQSAKYVGRMRAILRGCPTDASAPCTDDEPHAPRDRRPSSRSSAAPTTAPTSRASTTSSSSRRSSRSTSGARGVTKEKLTEELSKRARRGVPRRRLQLLADDLATTSKRRCRASRARTRSRSFGPDLRVNEEKADEIVDVMATVRGVEDLGMFRSLGQPNVRITPDRVAVRRATASTSATSRRWCRRPSAARR